ncbi:hypothetical protein B0H63DRAFT_556941 [Podospora didyma]|uniref:Uncharacterized protein n=1 Tax=Podospora didyma TaxID=330526 RepID=A0AAE0NYG2_9PEZI|nr:hypothetical protein B0H63DRAFT_556941 [Podospora didyma]
MFEALERAIEIQRKKIAKEAGGIRDSQDYGNELLMHLHSVRIMFDLRRIRALGPGPDSDQYQLTHLDYMLLGWNQKATRMHDKVYGLLGLIGESTSDCVNNQSRSFAVDYTIPAEATFALYTWFMLSQDRRLTSLSLARDVETQRRLAAALTWSESGLWSGLAPNWSKLSGKFEWMLKHPIDEQEKTSWKDNKRTSLAELQSRWDVFLHEVDVDGHVQDTVDTLHHGHRVDTFFLVFRYL